MIKKNYIIRFNERSTSVGSGFPRQNTLMDINGNGLVVNHEKNNIPDEKEVLRHLIGIQEQYTIVQGNSYQEALSEFNSFKSCNTGTLKKAWALLNDKHHPIIEYSGCKYIVDKGFLTCQRYAEPNEFDNMYCVLDGLDEPPHDCPIQNQKKSVGYRTEVVEIDGIWLKRFSQNVIPMQPLNEIKPTFIN